MQTTACKQQTKEPLIKQTLKYPNKCPTLVSTPLRVQTFTAPELDMATITSSVMRE